MPHARAIHPQFLARWLWRRVPHGFRAWYLLPRLLLAPVRDPLPARHHEYRRHGAGNSPDLCRESAALRTPDQPTGRTGIDHLWRAGHIFTRRAPYGDVISRANQMDRFEGDRKGPSPLN